MNQGLLSDFAFSDEEESKQIRNASVHYLLQEKIVEIQDLESELLYQLPQLKSVSIIQQQDRKKDSDNLNEIEMSIVSNLEQYFTQQFQTWEIEKYNKMTDDYLHTKKIQYPFLLPTTIFQQNDPPIIYQNFDNLSEEGQGGVMEKLTNTQLADIWQTGTFQIPSNFYPIPYTWRINDCLFTGVQPAIEDFQSCCSIAFDLIHKIPRYFYQKNKKLQVLDEIIQKMGEKYMQSIDKHRRGNSSICCLCCCCQDSSCSRFGGLRQPDLITGLFHALLFPIKILNIFVGLPSYLTPRKDEIYFELNKLRMNRLNEQDPNIDMEFFNYLFVNQDILDSVNRDEALNLIGERKNQLKKLNNVFLEKSAQIIDEISEKFSNLNKYDFFQKIREQKIALLVSLINQSFEKRNCELRVQNHLVQLIKSIEVIAWLQHLMKEEIHELLEKNMKKIFEENTIRARISSWRNSKLINMSEEDVRGIQKSYQEKINQELHLKVPEDSLHHNQSLFLDYINFRKESQKTIKKFGPEYRKKNQIPMRVYYTHRTLLKPYKRHFDGKIWHVINTDTYQVSTDLFTWRLQLFFVRWFVWGFNCFVKFFHFSFNSPFGLKALIFCQEYPTDESINQYTGKSIPSNFVQPYVVRLGLVWTGITESREEFEAQPDTGFFGKSFSRICNLIECYIFRLLIVGVIFIGIFYPILIIVNSILCFVFALTSFIWIIFPLILRYLFHWIIYDFDNPRNQLNYSQLLQTDNLRYLSIRVLPIVMQPLEFAFRGIAQIYASLIFGLVVHELLAVLILIASIFKWLFIRLQDCFLMMFIRCLGRQPVTDSCFARQISGMGLGRQFCSSIESEDVQILVAAQMERQQLLELEKKMKVLIYQPSETAKLSVKKIMAPFNGHVMIPPLIYSDCDALWNSFQRVLQSRFDQFPNIPQLQIQFTKQELIDNFSQSQNLVQNAYESKQMTYIWANMDVNVEDFNGLTKAIWFNIFQHSNNILEPIEEAELRFQLQKDVKSEALHAVKAAIKGQSLNNDLLPVFQPQNPFSLVSDTCAFNDINAIVKYCDEIMGVGSGSFLNNKWDHYQQGPFYLYSQIINPKFYKSLSRTDLILDVGKSEVSRAGSDSKSDFKINV